MHFGKLVCKYSKRRSRALLFQPFQCLKVHFSLIYFYRMNKAMTLGFEKHVGNKTTHHIMYPESAVDLAPGVNLVLLPFKLRDLEWVSSALSTGEIKMYVPDPAKSTHQHII